MSDKPLPLFESLAAVFGMAVVALLVALPSSGSSEEESAERVLQSSGCAIKSILSAAS